MMAETGGGSGVRRDALLGILLPKFVSDAPQPPSFGIITEVNIVIMPEFLPALRARRFDFNRCLIRHHCVLECIAAIIGAKLNQRATNAPKSRRGRMVS